MCQIVWYCLILATAGSFSFCQELPLNYSAKSVAGAGAGMCPNTQDLRGSIKQDISSLINSSVLPVLGTGTGHGACGCGGPGWRKAAYLNMSNPTQTCPPAWELITTPRRSCARPSNAGIFTCYSAIFATQASIQYSQVCGRIIGYQVGQPEAFSASLEDIDQRYVDGVSLTYGNPRQHIWTFANAMLEAQGFFSCPCTNTNEQGTVFIPSFVGNDYFCETGVPPGQSSRQLIFYADDPLWDGQGCGPNSTCCTFNNPPWFCKQLPQSTNADLEVRLCSINAARVENTPVELIEIYVK